MPTFKKILKKTDAFRRKATRNLINFLVFFARKKKQKPIVRENVKKILICRPNQRLGNQLLITPLVREVNRTFPEAKIHLFLKGGLGNVIFENYLAVEKIITLPKKHFKELFKYIYCWISLKTYKYDLVINAGLHSSSGRFATQIARSKYHFLEEEISDRLPSDYHHIAKTTIYQLREFLQKSGIPNTKNEIPSLDINLKEEEKTNGQNILKKITKNEKPTIGIYTFATLDKCCSTEFWLPLYQELKKKYENEYNIIEVLPIENVSQIDFIAPHFYSKDIRELASMISAMKVFISADCGMMHLASSSKIPVIGLFKFKNVEKYKPYNNKSVGIYPEDLNIPTILTHVDNVLFHKTALQ